MILCDCIYCECDATVLSDEGVCALCEIGEHKEVDEYSFDEELDFGINLGPDECE